ncbi:MAG TPA: LPS export ABC transporter periplasmic protein LptC [Candidatus Mcinerneyibacterium sp.]|nr:LPS export ABC transporter periplasmic protein LptC [Candidatus Mcinerneyibacterium sp.]
MKKIIYVLFIIGLIFLAGCSEKKKREEKAPELGQVFDEGLTVKATRQGKPEWKMKVSKLIQKENNLKSVEGENVEIEFFGDQEKKIAEIEADTGTANLTSNDIELNGNVILKNISDQTTLYTEKLFYDSIKEKVYTEEEVKIEQADGIIKGRGLEADLRLKEVVLKETYGQN